LFKKIFVASILLLVIMTILSMAGDEWLVYVNNKPFTGTVIAQKGNVLVSIDELSKILKFEYTYDKEAKVLKVNKGGYAGQVISKNGKVLVSLTEIAVTIKARAYTDTNTRMATIESFTLQNVPPASTPVPTKPGATPQASTGNEVQVGGLTRMTDMELSSKDKNIVNTGGVKGTVTNTAKVLAKEVVATVYVKDPKDNKIQETLTYNIGELKPNETKSFEVFYFDGSKYYDTKNPAIVYPGIMWDYEGKATFKLDLPTPTPKMQ